MRRQIPISLIAGVLALALAGRARGQSDEMPLGDLARQLRKTQPPPRTVIDNDNLPAVMEEGESRKWSAMSVRFSLDQTSMHIVNASSPDVTCALSFSATGSTPAGARPQVLPGAELAKLDGPATIVGDELQVAVYNGSAWDLRELTVGLTLLRKTAASVAANAAVVKLLQATINEPVTAEKHSDVTVLYHLKGAAAPFTTTQFREGLRTTPGAGQEWHWAIVEAKGIPPAAAGN